MSDVSRRQFLALTSASAAAACAPGPGDPTGDTTPSRTEGPYSAATGRIYVPSPDFPCGVLSADPTPDAVLLWTRVDPALDVGNGVEIRVEVATDRAFEAIVFTDTVMAKAERDHTMIVDATGLASATVYHYRFTVGDRASPAGRTRTAPAPDAAVDRCRVAWFSCQKWTHGYFNGHHDLSWMAADPATDVDLVISLGDYVYDSSHNNKPRLDANGDWTTVLVPSRDDEEPLQAETLDDFRARYKHYRRDINLQAMHANFPFAGVYDNHDGNVPGNRKREGAVGAFHEYIPTRSPDADPTRIHRSLRWGDVAEVLLTDQNSFRDEDAATLLGEAQFDWLVAGLTSSTAAWKVFGSQKVFSPFRVAGLDLGLSAWDDVGEERQALLDAWSEAGIEDLMVLSGDAHVFLGIQLPAEIDDDLLGPPLLTEFCSGMTSSNFDERGVGPSRETWAAFSPANPHLAYAQLDLNGYGIAEYRHDGATVTLRRPLTITEPSTDTEDLAVFEIARGDATLVQVAGAPPEEA